jgi:dynein heavy chain
VSALETYYAPPEGTLDESRAYIENLPLEDDPEVFGLHPNANVTFQQKTVNEFKDTVLSIQPRVTGGKSTLTPEEIVDNLAKDI